MVVFHGVKLRNPGYRMQWTHSSTSDVHFSCKSCFRGTSNVHRKVGGSRSSPYERSVHACCTSNFYCNMFACTVLLPPSFMNSSQVSDTYPLGPVRMAVMELDW